LKNQGLCTSWLVRESPNWSVKPSHARVEDVNTVNIAFWIEIADPSVEYVDVIVKQGKKVVR